MVGPRSNAGFEPRFGSRRSAVPAGLLLGIALFVASGCDEQPAELAPAAPSACSPRRWTFATQTLDGVRVDAPVAPHLPLPYAGMAPPFQGMVSPALGIPEAFDAIRYYTEVTVPVCNPTATANLLHRRFSTRIFLEGGSFAEGTEVTVNVYPAMAGAKGPLELSRVGTWIPYAGVFEPSSSAGDADYATATDVVITFIYVGAAAWNGTIWIDDISIEN